MSDNNNKPNYSYSTILKGYWQFAKPFSLLIVLLLILNVIFSVLSALSVALIHPIFDILFGATTPEISKVTSSSNSLQELKNWFFNLVNNIIVTDNFQSTLINLSFLVVGVFILKNITKYFSSVVNVMVEEGILKQIRDSIFNKITTLGIDFFIRNQQGRLISILNNDASILNGSSIGSVTSFVREFIQFIIFLVLLLSISTKLTLIAFSTSIFSIFILRFAVKYLKKYANRMQLAMAEFTSVLQETLSGMKIIKAHGYEKQSIAKFQNQTQSYLSSAIKHQKVITMIPGFNEIFAIGALCIVLYVGGLEVLVAKSMTSSELMTFLFSLFSIMSPVALLFNAVSNFQRGSVAGQRVFALLNTPNNIISGSQSTTEFKDSLIVKNITFEYNNEIDVVKNVDIVIKKSQKVAFVGASGSGKSTMLDLIMRYYDPKQGSIEFDGTNIKEYDLTDYLKQFGVVSQETILFNDTIENNIKFGQNVGKEEVINAAKLANAFDFVDKLPDKFDTIIGERGMSLSGGERQRIAIARALIRKPNILVFDEATSALDSNSEKIVQDAISNSLSGKTAIIVAHRLSTIRDCDMIYVFDKGQIAESGNHQSLTEQNGIYKKLCDIQYSSI